MCCILGRSVRNSREQARNSKAVCAASFSISTCSAALSPPGLVGTTSVNILSLGFFDLSPLIADLSWGREVWIRCASGCELAFLLFSSSRSESIGDASPIIQNHHLHCIYFIVYKYNCQV